MEFRVFRRRILLAAVGTCVKRIVWILGLIGIASMVWLNQDLVSGQSLIENYVLFKTLIHEHYSASLIVFFIAYVISVGLSLPVASILTLMGAALYGWIALPVIVTAATVGALVVFILASTIASDFFYQRTNHVIDGVRFAFLKSPKRWLLTMRLIPFFPFWLVNIVPALLQMKWYDYVFATALGIIPGTAIYVGVGRGLDTVLSSGETPQWSVFENPEIWVPLVILGSFSAISAWVSSRKKGGVRSC